VGRYYRPTQILAHGDYVYFGELGGVGRISVDGCTHGLLTEDSDYGNIALSATHVYTTFAGIVSLPLDGGAVKHVANGLGGSGIAIDSTNVYWIGGNNNVWKAPLDPDSGARFELVAGSQNLDGNLFLEGETLFVPFNGPGTIAMATSGATFKKLAPRAMFVDESGLYTENEHSSGTCWIGKYSLNGEFLKFIGPVGCEFGRIASDLTTNRKYIFWWDMIAGKLMRACK
jgi:hypothetical protein